MSISGIGGSSPFMNIGAFGSVGSSLLAAETEKKTPRAEFMEYAQMTPAERMRAAMLSRMGLEEKDLAGMFAEEREAVEAKIKAMIKAQIEADQDKRPGRITDITV